MSQRGITILLLLTATIGLGAIVQDYRFDGWIAGQRAAALSVDADVVAITATIASLSQLRLVMNAVALLFVLSVAVLFGRALANNGKHAEPTTFQMLRELPPPLKTAGSTPANGNGAAASPGPAPPQAPAPTGMARSSTLSAAAELCVDLARVQDVHDIPALLERTATVLDARGVVLWAADQSGALLRPSMSHGYPDKVLIRLRPLQVDADNVTSLAFRSLKPQALNGMSVNDSAAIAIPLLTATGCVGVLAAELRHNRPPADLLPIAKIIGAQFSTLIAPAEAPDRRTAQA